MFRHTCRVWRANPSLSGLIGIVRGDGELDVRPGRIRAVEGARGVAMSLVFLIHLLEYLCPHAPPGSLDSHLIQWIYPVGNLAGVFFVVITGCFLYRSLLERPVKYGAFLRRRLMRIYSVFTVVLAFYIALSLAFPTASKLPSDPADRIVYLLENLLLLPGVFPIPPIITVSWTLSYVVLYCLILPPLIELTGMREWQAKSRVLFLILAAASCALGSEWTQAYPLRLALLPIGALASEALAWRKCHVSLGPSLESCALSLSAGALYLKYWLVYHDHAPVFACSVGLRQFTVSATCLFLLCFGLFSSYSPAAALLCGRNLRWLGNISYSYYLTHSLCIKFLTLFVPAVTIVLKSAFGFWAMIPLCFVASMIPAVILFRTVEKPASEFAGVQRSAGHHQRAYV